MLGPLLMMVEMNCPFNLVTTTIDVAKPFNDTIRGTKPLVQGTIGKQDVDVDSTASY